MSFDKLGLSHPIIYTLKNQGYTTAFPIQTAAIPAILSGNDVMGLASTGSGKTLTYVLPILNKLQQVSPAKNRHISVLVLVPTRELAVQVDEVFKLFADNLRRSIKTMAAFGGVSINPQMRGMNGVEVLIATPGRLIDLLDNNALSLSEVSHLVVDEADKMFQLGFEEEMNKILSLLPKRKQCLLFSATLNDKVAEMKAKLIIDPIMVEAEKVTTNLEQIEQVAYHVAAEKKGPFLRYLIKSENMEQVLIFVSSTRTADNLVEKLRKNGIKAMAIHGKKNQGARQGSLDFFRQKEFKVLVATDLIGRGIHIDELPVVINYELPRSPLDYVHRIGRTGRANHFGKAISLLTEEDMHHFKVIQKKMGKQVEIKSTEDVNLHGF